MGSRRYEVEVTVGSARDLKNVNWRHGELKPYVVLWINDNGPKSSTRAGNGENPDWNDDDKVLVPLPTSSSSLSDAVLYIDIVHATDNNEDVKTKPLVGSARLPLRDVVDDAGVGGNKASSRTLRLKRPSGRPQGRIDVRAAVREAAARYYDSENPYPAPSYVQQQAPAGAGSRDATYYGQPAPYAAAVAAPGGYGYACGAPTQPAYGMAAPLSAAVDPNSQQQNKSGGSNKMGMGTGLAVGAAAGVLGGLALAGGASYLENKFEDSVAEKVDEELAARNDDDGGYEDDYLKQYRGAGTRRTHASTSPK